MTNRMFVAAAFALTWSVIVGYIVHLRRVRRRAQALLDGAATRDVR
jgi:CcmD family protein